MKYEWWNLPDDPNRVGDEDYKPNASLTFRDEDEEYQFYLDQREPMLVPHEPLKICLNGTDVYDTRNRKDRRIAKSLERKRKWEK